MAHLAKRHWPLLVTIGVLCLAVSVPLMLSIDRNRGHLVYALDDPYIHMAMAKNLAQHGVWGVTKYSFSSSSSSPLWTLLLTSVYFVLGANEVAPLVLNIVFAVCMCVVLHVLFRRNQVSPTVSFVAMLAVVFLTPVPALVFSGSEHTLHALLTLLFVYHSAVMLSAPRPSRAEALPALMLASLVVMTRDEGIFCVLAVSCLLLVRKQWLLAMCAAALGGLPIVALGAISAVQGWWFLPNSVLLKGRMPDLSSPKGIVELLGYSGLRELMGAPHVLLLLLAGIVVLHSELGRQKTIWSRSTIMLAVAIATTCLHMQFARTGWFYRYEAYLVGLGIFVLTLAVHAWLPGHMLVLLRQRPVLQCIPLGLLTIVVAFPFVSRGGNALRQIPVGTENIYQQQYQMGLFLREFYEHRGVGANDVGAINYLGEIRCVDLWGLANLEVARARRSGQYDAELVDELATSQDVSIAVVYDCVPIPAHWTRVGQWRIPRPTTVGSDVVSFCAVDEDEVESLAHNLQQFASRLPTEVMQTGMYVDDMRE